MNMIPIADVRKGVRVQLRNGLYATVADNTVKHNTRTATVEGNFTETGSVYSTDIVRARVVGTGLKVTDQGTVWLEVAHTKPQLEASTLRKSMGF